ncbi:hypothetical protein BT69DRAFT_1303998 [Atractiella rhizophila]|nr:hypothetical protein BT69DRAFT_1303998 [Atractiella rhizophila]
MSADSWRFFHGIGVNVLLITLFFFLRDGWHTDCIIIPKRIPLLTPSDSPLFKISPSNRPAAASVDAETTTLSSLVTNTFNSIFPSFCVPEDTQTFTLTETAAIGKANLATLLKAGNMFVVSLVAEVRSLQREIETLKAFQSILTDTKPVIEPPIQHTPFLFKPDGTIPIPPKWKADRYTLQAIPPSRPATIPIEFWVHSQKNEGHRHWLVGEDGVRVHEDASIRLLSRNLLDEIISASQYRNSKWRHLLAEQNAIDVMTGVLESEFPALRLYDGHFKANAFLKEAFNEQKKKWRAADGLPKKIKKSVKEEAKDEEQHETPLTNRFSKSTIPTHPRYPLAATLHQLSPTLTIDHTVNLERPGSLIFIYLGFDT